MATSVLTWMEVTPPGGARLKSLTMEVPVHFVRERWPLGKIVCWQALLMVTKCLTTNHRTADDCACLPSCLSGLLECFAHYFPQWFGWFRQAQTGGSNAQCGDRWAAEYFPSADQSSSWRAVARPRLFDQWMRDLFLQHAAPSRDRAWFATHISPAYDDARIDKVSWAHPVWMILHVFPLVGHMEDDVAAEARYCQAFLMSWAKLIPCPLCRHHKWEYCSHAPVPAARASRIQELRQYIFKWTVDLHNSVNERAKPVPAAVLDYEEAIRAWAGVAQRWNDPYD